MHVYLVAAGPAEADRGASAVAGGAGSVASLARVAEPGRRSILGSNSMTEV